MKELKAIKWEPSQEDLAQKDSAVRQHWECGNSVRAKAKFQKHSHYLFGKATATSGWMAPLGVRRDTLPSRTLVNSPYLSSCWAPEQVSKERQTTHLASALFYFILPGKVSENSESCQACSCGGFLRETGHILNLGLSSRTSGFCAFLLAADAKILFILQPLEFILFQVP